MFKLQNHFGSIVDTRTIKPWDIPGFELTILRAGHPDWQAWLEEHRATNPLVRNIMKESVRLSLANRRKKKADRMSDEEIMDMAVDNAADKTEETTAVNLEELKDGIANVVIREWNGVETATRRCNDCNHEWEPDKFGELCPSCGSQVSMDFGVPIKLSPIEARKLLDNGRDEDGNLRWVPKHLPDGRLAQCGNGPWGDCLTNLILEEMNEGEEFYVDFKGAAAKNSESTPGGLTAITCA